MSRRWVFIGRWSPFHAGHKAMIDAKLCEGEKALVLVRERPTSADDPWTAEERAAMIRLVYPDEEQVQIRVIPDVAGVVYGRAPGYQIEEFAPEQFVSGAAIRQALRDSDGSWRWMVPEVLHDYLHDWRQRCDCS